MDKSILLQKQVRDNSEDLQREFLDMKNWEEQMKRKDQELLQESGQQQDSLPPIRNQKQKKVSKGQSKQAGDESRPKRIRSYDYKTWDKFDVEKACKDLDEDDYSHESSEELSPEQCEKDYEGAEKYKQEGNVFVGQQKWDKALQCYSKAIKLFPYDAIYYANRALCHLKMDNLHSAESDCTFAIRLNDMYVKAYHRRATARISLKQYKEAKSDLEKVLELEPSNKETKTLLAEVNKKFKSSKPLISEIKTKDSIPIEKKIGEKIFGSSKAEKKKETVVKEKDIDKAKVDTEKNDAKREKEDLKKELQIDKGKNVSCETKKEIRSKEVSPITVHERDTRIPDWLPEKDNVTVVEPISKPSHLKSKEPLKKIPVREVDFVLAKKVETSEKCESKPKCEKEPRLEQVNVSNNETITDETNSSKVSELVENVLKIPPVPKTAVQFIRDWKTNKSLEFRYKYLKQFPRNSLATIFQDSMEANIFSDIVTVLQSEFIKRREPVFQILEDLSHVKRFRALIMFISNADKDGLKNLFEYCKDVEDKAPDVLTELRNKYEI